jgi:hypothetical protein
MATCYDEPTEVFDSQRCLDAVSKDAKGTVRISAKHDALCEERKCTTFHTVGPLKLTTTVDKPCDSKLSLKLATGTFTVARLATSYDTDGLQRGVHAGDFSWSFAGTHVQIAGRMSGITNAGILRAPVFQHECEACSTPGLMIGRLCGEVVGSAPARYKGAQLVAVYRFEVAKPSKEGAAGGVIGTIEGVLVEQC